MGTAAAMMTTDTNNESTAATFVVKITMVKSIVRQWGWGNGSAVPWASATAVV